MPVSQKLSGRVSSRDVSFRQEAVAVPDSSRLHSARAPEAANRAGSTRAGGSVTITAHAAGHESGAHTPGSHSKEVQREHERNSWFDEAEEKFFTSRGSSKESRRKQMRQDLSHPPATSGIAGVIIGSFTFQMTMGFCIVSNAAVIGLETDNPTFQFWEFVELFFLLVFSLEFLLRLRVFGIQVYFHKRNPDFVWNAFDAGIVISGVVGTTLEHLHLIAAHRSGGFSTLLRVIRLLRVFRIFRLVRMLKQLYMLVFGFGIAALATIWVTILFVVMLYVCAVMAVKLRVTVPDSDTNLSLLLNERFLTVRIAMFSLFELMLNPDLARYEELLGRSQLFTCFIIIFVIFGSFGMLALLTGVISEAMFEKNTMRLEEERTEREERRHILNALCGSIFDEMLGDEQKQTSSLVPTAGDRQSHSKPAHRLSVIKRLQQELAVETLETNIPRMNEVFQKRGFHFAHHDLVEVLAYVDDDHSGRISKREFSHAICSISEGVQASTVLELHKSISRRAGEVEKEMASVIDLTRHRDKKLDHDLKSINKTHEDLDKQVDKLLTLLPQLPSGGVAQGAAAQDAVAQGEEAGQPAYPDQRSEQSSSFCPTCQRDSNNTVDTTKLALRVDAFESVLRQMHQTVNGLLQREKNKAQLAAQGLGPPGGPSEQWTPNGSAPRSQPAEQFLQASALFATPGEPASSRASERFLQPFPMLATPREPASSRSVSDFPPPSARGPSPAWQAAQASVWGRSMPAPLGEQYSVPARSWPAPPGEQWERSMPAQPGEPWRARQFELPLGQYEQALQRDLLEGRAQAAAPFRDMRQAPGPAPSSQDWRAPSSQDWRAQAMAAFRGFRPPGPGPGSLQGRQAAPEFEVPSSRPSDRQARQPESWNGMFFEVPMDPLDQALDLVAGDSPSPADLISLDQTSTARSELRSAPQTARSEDSCVD